MPILIGIVAAWSSHLRRLGLVKVAALFGLCGGVSSRGHCHEITLNLYYCPVWAIGFAANHNNEGHMMQTIKR